MRTLQRVAIASAIAPGIPYDPLKDFAGATQQSGQGGRPRK